MPLKSCLSSLSTTRSWWHTGTVWQQIWFLENVPWFLTIKLNTINYPIVSLKQPLRFPCILLSRSSLRIIISNMSFLSFFFFSLHKSITTECSLLQRELICQGKVTAAQSVAILNVFFIKIMCQGKLMDNFAVLAVSRKAFAVLMESKLGHWMQFLKV